VVYPQHRQPTAKIRAFIDFAAGLFPQSAQAASITAAPQPLQRAARVESQPRVAAPPPFP
jgi:hypothetical protein